MTTSNQPIRVTLLAFEGISAFHLSVPCLVFQDAALQGPPRFELKVCAAHPASVATASGFGVTLPHDLSAIEDADIVVIPSWPNALPDPDPQLLEALRQQHERGAVMVGLCLGSYALACAGLLDGMRITTHWGVCGNISTTIPRYRGRPDATVY